MDEQQAGVEQEQATDVAASAGKRRRRRTAEQKPEAITLKSEVVRLRPQTHARMEVLRKANSIARITDVVDVLLAFWEQHNGALKVDGDQQAEPADDPNLPIGERVLRFRLAAKVSQRAFAKAAGIPQPTISRIESGKHNPTASQRQALARMGLAGLA